jgi:hypothetical protein
VRDDADLDVHERRVGLEARQKGRAARGRREEPLEGDVRGLALDDRFNGARDVAVWACDELPGRRPSRSVSAPIKSAGAITTVHSVVMTTQHIKRIFDYRLDYG